MAHSGDSGGEGVKLVERPFFEMFKNEVLYPALYDPLQVLDSYLWDNRHLFTLIGVFGAVTVYLRTVEAEISESLGGLGDFAVFSGLSLVGFLSLIALIKLAIQLRHHTVRESLLLYVFATLFLQLMVVITGIVSTFSQLLSGYYFMAVYVLGSGTGILMAMGIAIAAKRADDIWDIEVPIVPTLVYLLGAIVFIFAMGIIQIKLGAIPDTESLVLLTLRDWLQLYSVMAFGIGTIVAALLFLTSLAMTSFVIVGYGALQLRSWWRT